MFGYIYKTTNLITNKIYIGQKKSEEFLSNKYFGSRLYKKRAIKKYGKENFSVIMLVACNSKEELDISERYWISYFNSTNTKIGYNLTEGGEGNNGGAFKGHTHTEEVRKKISTSMHEYNQKYRKGKKMTDLFPNFVNGMKGKEAKNKGQIQIYNPELDKIKYIAKEDNIENYPGFLLTSKNKYLKEILGIVNNNIDEYGLKKLPHKKDGYDSARNTRYMYNEELKVCKRIKDFEINKYLAEGWKFGRRIYK